MASRIDLYHIRRSLPLRLTLLVLLALGSGLGLAACGGDGGSSGNSTFQGIWTGTATPNSGVGTSKLEFEFFQSGNTLTGESVITSNGIPQTGSLNGTVSGTTFNIKVNIGSAGSPTITGSINGTSTALTGNYQTTPINGVSSKGTFSLTKSVGVTTPTIAKNFVGTSTVTGSAAKPLTLVVTQTQDSLTLTGISGTAGTSGALSLTGSGALIGNHFTGIITDAQNNVTYIDGTVSGTAISGTTSKPDGNGGVTPNGAFLLNSGP